MSDSRMAVRCVLGGWLRQLPHHSPGGQPRSAARGAGIGLTDCGAENSPGGTGQARAGRVPDLQQLLAPYGAQFAKRVQAVGLAHLGLLFKTNLHASEQDRPDVAQARKDWRESQAGRDPAKLVFIDETGAATKMVRRYGRAMKGQRLVSKAPHGAAGLRISPKTVDHHIVAILAKLSVSTRKEAASHAVTAAQLAKDRESPAPI